MKKLSLTMVILCLFVALVGCQSKDDRKQAAKQDKNEVGKMVETANNLEITVKRVKTGFGESSEKKDTLQVYFAIKNIGKDENGAGAADFKVKADNGKTYDVYGLEEKNFGTAIKAGKAIEGKGYYEIPKGTKKVTLYYEPQKQKMAQWKLNVPDK